jgi:eukaryotic-like serine/threonine-protein kinase
MLSPFYPLVKPPTPAPPTSVAHGASRMLTPGTVICGRYRVEHFIGRGAMGAVYAVYHLNTGESLALKVLHPVLASNAQAVERFRIEARAPVRIGTENVVRIIDADMSAELGDVPFLVMELLVGGDLDSELARRGALPPSDVVYYLQQVARALDRAHALGIIHRDLKPANLYLTRRDDGSPLVKILDFGIAKLADGVPRDITQDGAIFGTPWYMSPEQALGRAATVFPAADLWALGLIAYRLLTGRNYWTANAIAVLIGQIVSEPMPPPSQMAPKLGLAFDAWFARACNRDPEARFRSATEQVTGLAEALSVSLPEPLAVGPLPEPSGMTFGPPPNHAYARGATGSAPNLAAPPSPSFGPPSSAPEGLLVGGTSGPPSASFGPPSTSFGPPPSASYGSSPDGSYSLPPALLEVAHSAAPFSRSAPQSGKPADALASAGLVAPRSPLSSSPGSTSSLIVLPAAAGGTTRPSSALSVAFGVLVAVAAAGLATMTWAFLHSSSLGAPRASSGVSGAVPLGSPEAPAPAEPAPAALDAHPEETATPAATAPATDLAAPAPSADPAPSASSAAPPGGDVTPPEPRTPLPASERQRPKPPLPTSTNPQARSAPRVGKIRF